jgi:hypothetical protein
MAQYNKTRSNVGQNVYGIQVCSGSGGGSDDPKPVASDFTSIGNGTPLLADEIIDGGLSDAGSGLACGDGSFYGFDDLLPSGLSSDGGDGVFLLGARNRSASNATGNLVGPDSGADPFAAPLAELI